MGGIELQTLYCHCAALVLSFEYCCVIPIVHLSKLSIKTAGNVHGFWYALLMTAQLAQDVEQLVSVMATYSTFKHLESPLVWCWKELKLQKDTLSILSIRP